jgi:hypothetical protein
VAIIAVAVLSLSVGLNDQRADANHAGGMDAMSIDMDPHATPANARAGEYGSDCANTIDDDTDTRVNDGCPATPAAVGNPESGFACNDLLISLDNDLDGVANDGCSETSCLDNVDNDRDSIANDGCPAVGTGTLGSREPCGRINENDFLDADEDSPDTVLLDVTATSIPSSNPMIAFAYTLEYPSFSLTVESHDPSFLLATAPRSSLFDVSQPTPDDNDDNRWSAAVADTGDPVGENGSGVLSRLSVSSEAGATPGVHTLTLVEAAHVDPENNSLPPDALVGGTLAVDQPCP